MGLEKISCALRKVWKSTYVNLCYSREMGCLVAKLFSEGWQYELRYVAEADHVRRFRDVEQYNVCSTILWNKQRHTQNKPTKNIKHSLNICFARNHMMTCGSGTEAPMDLCGRTLPPLMYSSSLTVTSSPNTDTFSMRTWEEQKHKQAYLRLWEIGAWRTVEMATSYQHN